MVGKFYSTNLSISWITVFFPCGITKQVPRKNYLSRDLKFEIPGYSRKDRKQGDLPGLNLQGAIIGAAFLVEIDKIGV